MTWTNRDADELGFTVTFIDRLVDPDVFTFSFTMVANDGRKVIDDDIRRNKFNF